MKINRSMMKVFESECGDTLRIRYRNMAEPFREGLDFDIIENGYDTVGIFLEAHEVEELRNFLVRLSGYYCAPLPKKMCLACDGSGNYYEDECPACGGRGWTE